VLEPAVPSSRITGGVLTVVKFCMDSEYVASPMILWSERFRRMKRARATQIGL